VLLASGQDTFGITLATINKQQTKRNIMNTLDALAPSLSPLL
jgi:hypothetical protein